MEDNSLLVNVSLHKIYYKCGSSPVVISPSLHTELKTYTEKKIDLNQEKIVRISSFLLLGVKIQHLACHV